MTAVHDLRPSPPACRDGTVLRAQINEFTPNCVSQPDPDRGTIVFQRMTDNDFDGLLGSEKAPKISEEEWVQFQFHLKEWLLLRRDAASRRTGSPPGGGSGRRGWAARPTRRRATASHWTSSSRRLRGRPQAALSRPATSGCSASTPTPRGPPPPPRSWAGALLLPARTPPRQPARGAAQGGGRSSALRGRRLRRLEARCGLRSSPLPPPTARMSHLPREQARCARRSSCWTWAASARSTSATSGTRS